MKKPSTARIILTVVAILMIALLATIHTQAGTSPLTTLSPISPLPSPSPTFSPLPTPLAVGVVKFEAHSCGWPWFLAWLFCG